MAYQPRGGFPQVKRVAAAERPATPTAVDLMNARRDFAGATVRVRVKTADNPVRLFFSETDFRTGENYAQVEVGEVFSEPLELGSIWLAGVGGVAAVEVVATLKT